VAPAAAAAGEPCLQVSAAAPTDCVLALELGWLRELGYTRLGPVWAPPRYWRRRHSYLAVLRLVAAHVLAQPGPGVPHYVPKAAAELEPLLGLWPHVVLWPTATALSRHELVRLRAFPVHPVGVVAQPTWADGQWLGPAEFFCHDVDHARFKVREDLLARGIHVPDAYAGGSTFDAATGRHRTVIAGAAPHVDGHAWQRAAARCGMFTTWWGHLRALTATAPALAAAARWVGFELAHEKSLPLEPTAWRSALVDERPAHKLRTKWSTGFYGQQAPLAAVQQQVFAACGRWRTLLAEAIA
jgi:hypothetical protein